MAFPSFGSIFGSRFGRALGQGGGSFPYRLLDTFSTARAAGSVNGTPAEPTGQARTVTDTNSKLSITGGVASFATGGVGESDPGLWYPSMTRVLGLTILGQFSQTGQGVCLGWDTNTSGAFIESLRPLLGTGINVRTNGNSILVASGLTSGSTYFGAVVLRSTGSYIFVKGGSEYANWTLLWVGLAGNTASMFPAVGVIASTTIGTADNIRVPTALYIPQHLAYDTFTRSNGALGSTETTGPDGQSVTALVWLFSVGKWAIVTNAAVGTPAQGADVVVNGAFAADTDWTKGAGWTIGSGTANASAASANLTATVAPLTNGVWYQSQYTLSAFAAGTVRARLGGTNCPTRNANNTYVETQRAGGTSLVAVGAAFTGSLDNWSVKALTLADLFASVLVSTADVWAYANITLENATSGKQAGLVLNLDNTAAPANFIIVYLDGAGNIIVDECVAGVYANKLAATAITYSAGATLAVMRSGTELRVFYNNAAVGGAVTMTANTNKNHGLFSTSPLNSLDNFLVMARGTSGEYAGLDAF